jgi:hypothetical protein
MLQTTQTRRVRPMRCLLHRSESRINIPRYPYYPFLIPALLKKATKPPGTDLGENLLDTGTLVKQKDVEIGNEVQTFPY